MAEYNSSFQKGGALLIDTEVICDLVEIIQKFLNLAPKIEIKLAGGHQIEGADVDELLADPYVKSKHIKSIEIGGFARNESRRHVSVTMSNDILDAPFSLRLRGDRDASIYARDNIEKMIDARKQWYSFLKTPNYFVGLILGLVTILAASIFIPIAVFRLLSIPILISDKEVNNTFVILVLLVFVVLNSLNVKLFPKMIFDIGRSSQKAKSAQHWRTLVGVGIVLASVVGLIVNFLTERLMH